MEQWLQEEAELQFTSFHSDDAYAIGSELVAYGKQQQLNIGIDIFICGKQVFHYLANGTIADNDNWLRRKRNTVLHFGHSTMFVFHKQKEKQSLLEEKYGLSLHDYTITPGGFPIQIKNTGVIGALCVSGLSAQEDHELCVLALRKHLSNQAK